MESKVITLTMFNDYPYSLIKDFSNLKVLVQVKHSLDYSSESQVVTKQKIRLLQNFSLKNLVKLLCFQEVQSKLNLFYEYIPRRLDNELQNVKPSYVEQVQQNLLLLAQNLAYHYVVHQFKIENVGLDQSNQLKYFLGFAFKIDKMINKQETANRYFKVIKGFFSEGGKLHRVQSPFQLPKHQYYETIDSQSCKLNDFNLSPQLMVPQIESRAGMKKSATACDNMDEEIKNHFNLGIAKRFSLNPLCKDITKQPLLRDFQLSLEVPKQEGKQIAKNQMISSQPLDSKIGKSSKSNYNSSTNNQTKMIKVEQMAARISKFKNIMKEVTGRISTGNAAASHQIVMAEKIAEQKKMAEYKQIKLSRPYGERQKLNNNQGMQVPSTGKKENNVTSSNNSNPPKVIYGIMEPNTFKNKQFQKIFPSHMQRNKSEAEPKKTEKLSVDTSKKRQQAPKVLEDAQSKQYRKMARNDKYCEQFMQFLDDNASPKKQDKKRPIHHLITQMIIQQEKQEQKMADGDQGTDIHNRVKIAIRNSLKLISGLKERESQVLQ